MHGQQNIKKDILVVKMPTLKDPPFSESLGIVVRVGFTFMSS